MIREDRVVQEFLHLVKIASPSGKEKEVAEYIRERMRQEGLEVVVDSQAAALAGYETGNVLGRLPGNVAGATPLFFSAHMDTVVPGEGIKPIKRDGVIYSDGATILGADDKSGIAALFEVLVHLREESIPHGDLQFIFTFGEEIGLLGAKYLDPLLLKAKQGFVLDSGGEPGTIINQGPAQRDFRVVIHGKAAHAGMSPEEGISAIQVAARAIDRMKLLRIDEETTANIGIISGGRATNIVCPQVEMKGEARSHSAAKLEQQSRHMVETLQQACRDFGAQMDLETTTMYEAFKVEESDSLVVLAKNAARNIGLPETVLSSGGGSDTNIFNAKGLRAVNLATGMSKVHTTEEFIRVEHLTATARWIAEIVKENARLARIE